VVLFLALCGVARSQNSDHAMPKANDPALARNDSERELFKQIVCQCGTCGRQVLSECSCGTAAEMRRTIHGLLDSGKTHQQVIEYELATYPGQSALVVPLDKGFNRLAWALPYGIILGAVGLLVRFGRSVGRRDREKKAAEPTKPEPSAKPADEQDAELNARLDDELDELD